MFLLDTGSFISSFYSGLSASNQLLLGQISASFVLFAIIGLCPGPSFASLFLYCPGDRWGGFKLTVAGLSFLVFLNTIALVLTSFGHAITYWIFIICCILSSVFLLQMIYLGLRTVFQELRLMHEGRSTIDLMSAQPTIRERLSKNPGPWYFGTVTSWFNPYYYAVVLPQFITYSSMDFRVAMNTGGSFLQGIPAPLAYIVFILMLTIAIYVPFCVLFTIYGVMIHHSTDSFGSRFVLITNFINLVFLTILLCDTLIKLCLGPSHLAIFAMSNGYLFHNVPLLSMVF